MENDGIQTRAQRKEITARIGNGATCGVNSISLQFKVMNQLIYLTRFCWQFELFIDDEEILVLKGHTFLILFK
ncbi:MAG: hypothetical protein MRK01_05325 [Candidatus Scalindua sp.]|nr:hypothetical protein [Candidatus Scalindua sp.]